MERRRKQELVNATYHHVKKAITLLNHPNVPTVNASARADITNNPAYTPYIVISADADLTYNHIIGVMEWLDPQGEESVVDYFYEQSSLNAIAASFELEYVRNWPNTRKLKLFDLYVAQQESTLTAAKKAERVLIKLVK